MIHNWRTARQQILIILLGLAAFGPALKTGFLYDDHLLIESNPYIRSWSVKNVAHDFSSGIFNDHGHLNYLRPLQTFTTRLEYGLWGLRPFGYHLTNLLLHLGNALLLREFVLIIGFSPAVALITACLFVVHPMTVEPMLMVSGRGELLGFFFTLVCLLFLLRGTRKGLFLGLAAYSVGLLSKESAIMTPVFFALSLYLKDSPSRRYRALVPLCALTLPYLWLRSHAVGNLLPGIDPAIYLRFGWMAFPKVLGTYARLILVPWNLHTDRMLPPGYFWVLYTTGLAALICWTAMRRSRWPVFCLLWYIAALLPKIPLMCLESFMCEHWVYPALLGALLPAAILIAKGLTTPSRAARFFSHALFYVLLAVWGSIAQLNVFWRGTDEKLYRSAVRYTPSIIMKENLASVLLNQGRAGEAIPWLESILRQDPDNLPAARALAAARQIVNSTSPLRK